MHYTGITCITSNYTHPTVTSRQIVGFIRTVYAVPRRVLAAKGGITDPDQPCHSTFGPSPSSRGSQLVGLILRCLEPAPTVHTTQPAGPWIPWAPLRLILQVLMHSKRPPGQLVAYQDGRQVRSKMFSISNAHRRHGDFRGSEAKRG